MKNLSFAGKSCFTWVWNSLLLLLILLSAPAVKAGLSATPDPVFAKEILFIEDNVPDAMMLKQGARAGMEVVMLDARADGLQQIAQTLKGRRDITALHLISHGASGQMGLGAMSFNSQTLTARYDDIAVIRQSLAAHADILLYGCQVAEGERGQRFISQLAKVTGAHVAASENLVGSGKMGGSWTLASRTAAISAVSLKYPHYQYVFPSVAGSFTPNVSNFQTTPGTSAVIYYDGLLGTTNIPNIEYDLYYAALATPGVPSGYVSPYVSTTPPGAIFTHTDDSTASSDTGVGQLIIKSHDGTPFKLSQFDWQDPNGCNSTYTATAYMNNVSQGSYQWTITQSGTFSGTFAPGSFFYNINEVRITAAARGAGVCGDIIMGEGIANIVFADAINTDATLSALSTSTGTLSPSFASATTSYTVSVPNATSSLTVTPTTNNGAATVKVNGSTVASGSASGSISLNVGSNTITVIGKSSDSSTTKTYTITVTRAASSVATLSNLALSSGTLSPGFASGTTSYTASVSNVTSSITVTPTVTDTNATVTVNGTTVASGSASGSINLNVGSNMITTVVTAQDGTTTKTYTTTVTRAASSVATLSNLALSSGTLSPTFASGTTSYTAFVSNATTSITVTPTVTDSNATVTVNGTTVASGSASGVISLNVGSNTITTVVTGQDGTTTRTYTTTVTRAGSAVATLSNLGLSSGTLSPGFASGTTSYTASVPNTTTSVTVTPAVTDSNATVKVNGTTVASGSASGSISLNVGSNTITTVVTAQDGTTTQTYTVTVTRAPSGVATLSNLALSSGTLSPTFASGTTSYTAFVSNAITSITVTPTVTDATATIKVNGTAVASGSASGSISLSIGSNTITIVVTAQDGTTTQTYTVTVTRALSSVATLSNLALSSGTLSPGFASGTMSYTASVPNATTSLTITPAVTDSNATIKVNGITVASGSASGSINLNVGSNTITTVVTAQDGTTMQTYTVIVTRVSNNADLSALNLSGGTLSPAFASGTIAYTVSLPNVPGFITVTPTASDSGATMKVNGTTVASGSASGNISLNVGANTINVVVTSSDGSTTKTYTMTITRAASSVATLSNLTLSSGTLSPAFVSGTASYTASIPNATSSVTVTPVVTESNATVKVNGTTVASGSASGAISLNVGSNTITTVVTAQDGTTTQTYTLVVTRSASNVATLSNLTLSGGTLNPVFSSGTTNYTTAVPNATTSMTVTPTVNDTTATIRVNGATISSGSASGAISLNVGSNTITITVTAQDGITTQTYTVVVTRAPSSVANLSNLVLSSGTLNPGFASGTASYTVSVPNTTTSLTVTPTVNDVTATVNVNGVTVASGSASGSISLNVGSNTITTVVTAQDGTTTQTYTVTVTRAPSGVATLSNLALSSGTLSPGFSGGTGNYTAYVQNPITSMTVTPTVSDTTATVKVNGVTVVSGSASGAISLNVGSNTITTVVTAQDGTTTQTYTVTVTRALLISSNANLSTLSLSSGTLSPVFASGTISYTASVSNNVSSLTVTPTVIDSTATVKVNGTTVASGSASGSINLNVGSNTITTVVTAQDGTTTQTYTVSVTRAASVTATLNNLILSGGTLSPVFASAATSYTASVPNTTTSVTVTPLVADATATIKVNGITVISGNPSGSINLNVGANTITTVVTAQDGTTTKTYTVVITRAAPANGSLSGMVYVDVNANGVFDGGDQKLANVSLNLSGTDILGNTVNQTAVTDANGNFGFTGLPAGTYSLSETQPAGYADFSAASGTTVGNAGGNAIQNGVSGIVIPVTGGTFTGYQFRDMGASIGGYVYQDDNDNGLKDGAESGIAGVSMRLSGTDTAGNTVNLNTLTQADGSFSFSGLRGGSYTLTETRPANYVNGKETAGSAGGTVDNSGHGNTQVTKQISNISLGAGQTGQNYLFGELQSASLQGYVYVDSNNNGIKDAGETGLAGVHVTLSGTTADGSDVCTLRSTCVTVTAADGSFSFSNMMPGTYSLLKSSADIDGSKYADGMETVGVAGGTVNNQSFGTLPYQNAISTINLTSAIVVASNGKVNGYLFGVTPRTLNGLKLPIVSGSVIVNRGQGNQAASSVVGGWTVVLSQNNKAICSVTTNAQGFYQFDNLACAGYQQSGLPTGSGFTISFSKPGSSNLSLITNSGGNAGIAGAGSIRNLSLGSNDEITQQNLPLDPSGIIYDSMSRQPLAGASIAISGPPGFDPATQLVGGLAMQTQTTGQDGMYQFLLTNGYPSGVYSLKVTQWPAGYVQAYSSTLLPCAVSSLDVGPTPNPALVEASATAPSLSTKTHDPKACSGLISGGAATTQYYLNFTITNGVSAPVMNNHIPLDAIVAAKSSLVKTGDKSTAEMGDSVRYTVVFTQNSGTPAGQVSVRDVLPPGFKYIPGTATVNGNAITNPLGGVGPTLAFNLGPATVGQQITLSYRVRIAVGSMQGDGVNRATAYTCFQAGGCIDAKTLLPVSGAVASNQSSFKVTVGAGVFTTDACVAGKVFVDCNQNGIQDAGEPGIPGVRLYLEDGTNITTDPDGKYSYCGLKPMTHVIKLDSVTMPAGSVAGITSNRNLGDANSLLLDVKNGELIRGDFAEASCSPSVLEQIKLRQKPGQLRPPETRGSPGIRFSSKVKTVETTTTPAMPAKAPGNASMNDTAAEAHHAQ